MIMTTTMIKLSKSLPGTRWENVDYSLYTWNEITHLNRAREVQFLHAGFDLLNVLTVMKNQLTRIKFKYINMQEIQPR
jgi:hypothetical protein